MRKSTWPYSTGCAFWATISILPGALCSGTDRYSHCIRLNTGYPLTERSEKGIATLGRLIRELTGS